MPKELLEITSFNTGTVLAPDTVDIPKEAASYSLNLDSVTEDGKLKSIPGDSELTLTNAGLDGGPIYMSSGSESGGLAQLTVLTTLYYIVKDATGWVIGRAN
jgi:hypothetical protein